GTFDLRIWKKGYNTIFSQHTAIEPELQTFKLYKPATIAGRVVDDATGQPVKTFTVITGYHDEKLGLTFTGDGEEHKSKTSNGSFSFKLRWGSTTTQPVRVIADGYLV